MHTDVYRRELAQKLVLQIGYVGTQSVHRAGQIEFDQALLASPSGPVNGETVNLLNNAFMPYQGLSPGSLLTDSVLSGNFNALEMSLVRQMSRGLQFQASYTWSKNLDMVNGEGGLDTFELQLPTNNQFDLRHSSYGPANDDRPQRLVISAGPTMPRLNSLPTPLKYALNYWQFSGIALVSVRCGPERVRQQCRLGLCICWKPDQGAARARPCKPGHERFVV